MMRTLREWLKVIAVGIARSVGERRLLSSFAVLTACLPTLLLSTLAAPSVAQAQAQPQVGWCTYEDAGQSWACFSSPDAACYEQYLGAYSSQFG
jgi:hypothetical protein